MTLKRDELAADFMVQCEKGEPFECPHLADCPHEDKDLCLWQYEHADRIIEAHKALIQEIRAEVNIITCLDNFKDMDEAVTKLVFNLKQKYEVSNGT